MDARQHPRLPFEVRVAIKSKNNFYTGTSKDLSEGGIFVVMPNPPEPGTELGFQLVLGGERFMVFGTVSWLRPDSAATPESPAGCGIRWVSLEDGALEAIRRFVTVRPTDIHE